jgi:hypothetical protein
MPDQVCQYCGADLDANPPREDVGWLYAVECRACPPERREVRVLPRPVRVDALDCPGCGARIAPADSHPDVLVIKEMLYDVCPSCGERHTVRSVRKHRDVAGGTI